MRFRAPHRPSERKHAHHRLAAWQRLMLYATAAVLLLSGGVWLAVHYTLGAGAGELPHPLEAWCLKLHGLAAFAGVFVFGVLAAAHVPQGWRLVRRHRWAGQRNIGLALCAAAGLLALSGYALFYFAPENLRAALGWAHTGVGVAMGLLLVVHRRGVRVHPALPPTTQQT